MLAFQKPLVDPTTQILFRHNTCSELCLRFMAYLLSVISKLTWTPKVCRIIALWAVVRGLGLEF